MKKENYLLINNGGAMPAMRVIEPGTWPAGEAAPQWFAAYTRSRHEKRIAEHCVSIGIEHFLPLYTVHRAWKNRIRVDVRLPLFPNYIFVRFSPRQHTPLLRLPGVVSIVHNAAGSVVIPEEDVHGLQHAVRCTEFAPYAYLHVGDAVRIKRGPLEGLMGTVLRTKNGWRFVMTLGQIGKSIAAEVDGADLDLVAAGPGSATDAFVTDTMAVTA